MSACLAFTHAHAAPAGFHFPPPGQSLKNQNQRTPAEVGLDPDVIDALDGSGSRWAIWRHGYLVHVEGDFLRVDEVKSLVKVCFALSVGAAIQQGRIPSYHQPLSAWRPDLEGNDALATWQNALTQSTGFDYPGCDDDTDYLPGQMWTYSDLNIHELNQALARVYGRSDYRDQYWRVWDESFGGAIGMQGWSNEDATDHARLVLDLEDMGRIGLLILARGAWEDRVIVPMWFIEQLETEQTGGMLANYDGCNDGGVDLENEEFPEPPYGYLCWSNSSGRYYRQASPAWSFASGAGGFYLLWNRDLGIVYAGVGVDNSPGRRRVPQAIEDHVLGENPLVSTVGVAAGGVPVRAVTLAPPSPVPARDETTFRFSLAREGIVRLALFDIAGRRVATIEDGMLPAGAHVRRVALRDAAGAPLPAGWYRARLDAAGITETRGFLVVK